MPMPPNSASNSNSSGGSNSNGGKHSDVKSSKHHASSSSSHSRLSSRPSSIPPKPPTKFFAATLSSAAKQSYMNGHNSHSNHSSSFFARAVPANSASNSNSTSKSTSTPTPSEPAPEELSEAETVIAEDSIPHKKLKRLKRRRSSISEDPESWDIPKEPKKRSEVTKSSPPPPPPQQPPPVQPPPPTSKRKSSPPPPTKHRSTSPRPSGSSREALLRKHAKTGRDANGRLRLQRMCDKGKYDEAKELILMGADVNDRDYAGNTAIHEAALKGHRKIVELLLDHGAIIDVRSGPGDLDTPLIDAASNDHLEVVKLLLERGADPRIYNAQGKTSMDLVQEDKPNHKEIEKLLREATLKLKKRKHNDSSKTPEVDDLDTPDFMDPANAVPGTFPSPDFYSNHHSLQSSNSNSGPSDAGGPRRRGARAQSIRNDLLWMDLTTRTGRDQVYRRAADGDYEFVGNFLGNGYKPDADCLALAARHGHRDVVNLLLAFGADSNGITEEGDTPLQQTVGRGHYGTVKLLLDSGADPTVVNKRGKTLVDIAKESLSTDDKELALIAQSIQSWKQTKKNNTNTPTSSASPPPVEVKPEAKSSIKSEGKSRAPSESEPTRKIKKRKVSEPSSNGVSPSSSSSDLKSKAKEVEKKNPPASGTKLLLFGNKSLDTKPAVGRASVLGDKSRSSSIASEERRKSDVKKEGLTEKSGNPPEVKKTEVKRKDSVVKVQAEDKESSKGVAAAKESTVPTVASKKLEKRSDKVSEKHMKSEKQQPLTKSTKQEKPIKGEKGVSKVERTKSVEKLSSEKRLEKPSEKRVEKSTEKVLSNEKRVEKSDKKVEKIKQETQEKKLVSPQNTEKPTEKPSEKPSEKSGRVSKTPTPCSTPAPVSPAKEISSKQKEQLLQEQRDRSRREREKKMLLQIEEEERRSQEKKRRDEEMARQERLRQEQRDARRRAEYMEREQERLRRQQQQADADMRRHLPYGLRVAVYGPRSMDEVCKFLPIQLRIGRPGVDNAEYVVDVQVSLLLGIQNLYHVYPELSKKIVTDQEKTRLWTVMSSYLCKPIPEFGAGKNGKPPGSEDILRSFSEDRKRFMGMNFFWLRWEQVEEMIRRDHGVIYELYKQVGSVAIDLDYDDVKEQRAEEEAARQRREASERQFVRQLPMRLRVKVQTPGNVTGWGRSLMN